MQDLGKLEDPKMGDLRCSVERGEVSVWIFSAAWLPKTQETLFSWDHLEAMPHTTEVVIRKMQGVFIGLRNLEQFNRFTPRNY